MTEVQYDDLSRVSRVAYPGGSIASCGTGCERFEYDLAGNRKLHQLDGVVRRYQLDVADQLLRIEDAGGAVLESFLYDGAGRRTRRTVGAGQTNYKYDALGRLASVVAANATTFTYSPTGERYSRTTGGTLRARYVNAFYEFQTPAQPLRLVPGPGGVFSEISSGSESVRTLASDGTGNVSEVSTDGAGSTRLRYRAFGTIRSGLGFSERGFAGLRRDGPQGLIAMGPRHYDTATGRFLQPDPLGIAADQLYAYAASNPYRFHDPTGLLPESIRDLDPTSAFFVGLGKGALEGGAAGYVLGAVAGFCTVCAPVVAAGAISYAGYQLYQEYQNDFEGLQGFGAAVGNVFSGTATTAEAYQVGQLLGGLVGGGVGGIAGARAGLAARASITFESSGAGTAPAQLVRTIQHGEKVAGLIEEAKALTPS